MAWLFFTRPVVGFSTASAVLAAMGLRLWGSDLRPQLGGLLAANLVFLLFWGPRGRSRKRLERRFPALRV